MSKYKAGDVVYVKGDGDYKIVGPDTRGITSDIMYEAICLYDSYHGNEYIHERMIKGLTVSRFDY